MILLYTNRSQFQQYRPCTEVPLLAKYVWCYTVCIGPSYPDLHPHNACVFLLLTPARYALCLLSLCTGNFQIIVPSPYTHITVGWHIILYYLNVVFCMCGSYPSPYTHIIMWMWLPVWELLPIPSLYMHIICFIVYWTLTRDTNIWRMHGRQLVRLFPVSVVLVTWKNRYCMSWSHDRHNVKPQRRLEVRLHHVHNIAPLARLVWLEC